MTAKKVQVGWLLVDPEDYVDGEGFDVDLFMDAAELGDYSGDEVIEVNGGSYKISPLKLFVELPSATRPRPTPRRR
jgi:hypothetical protein